MNKHKLRSCLAELLTFELVFNMEITAVFFNGRVTDKYVAHEQVRQVDYKTQHLTAKVFSFTNTSQIQNLTISCKLYHG